MTRLPSERVRWKLQRENPTAFLQIPGKKVAEKNDKQEDSGLKPKDPGSPARKSRLNIFQIGLIAMLAVIMLSIFLSKNKNEADLNQFLEHLEAGHLKWVQLEDEEFIGVMQIPADYKPSAVAPESKDEAEKQKEDGNDKLDITLAPFVNELPSGEPFRFTTPAIRNPQKRKEILDLLQEKNIPTKIVSSSGFWSSILIWVFPFGLIIFLWIMMMRQSGQMGRTAMSFGKTRAKMAGESDDKVTFADVAGCPEAKEELMEVVDFLKEPEKYQTLGGRMPKGMLLVGPPGTGKTLMARAVAGEAARPFFQLSGSDFVEMFVGVGASRVRDLFEQAKGKAPCIVFVDELDAVGRHRGAGLGGGHDEREQTLNQLLVEMDGFDTTSGVIFLAATNRPDVLDPALLRPGRFDRQIVIDAPDLEGRKAILEVHAKNKTLADNVDFALIAANTSGFTGADIANLLNEAALMAARKNATEITQAELDEAVERVIAGPERRSRKLGKEELEKVAYHEAGHALVAALCENADPVRKISIIPRGHAALGYTMQTPEEDRYLTSKPDLLDRLKGLLAGRAAELLVFEELSTGASNDLERATHIARSMVCRFGMSEKLGPVVYGKDTQQVFLGRDMTQEERNFSEKTAQDIDDEVRRLIASANEEAMTILETNRICLNRIAETLLEKEVMQGEDLDRLLKELLGEEALPRANGRAGASMPSPPAAEVGDAEETSKAEA
jgi:cell division protease FtsH